ncbi:MAG: 3-deoxy-D-manno-octulosonic acid transferase, partial [Sulfurimonas sp.]
MTPFTLLYFLLALLLYVAAVPFLLLFSLKKKYRRSLPARFFLWNNPPFRHVDLWFHVCSLGESRALKPLLDSLPARDIGITAITQTGYDAARHYDAQVRYLPFEIFLPFWIRRPKTLVVLEAEFWYMLFVVASVRGAKVIVLNARISERSYPKYLKFRWFYQKIFHYVDTFFVQSEHDKVRFESLGARHIVVLGNMKLAQRIVATTHYDKLNVETIVAASTHE